MNVKGITIGGIILLALSTWASRVTGLVTDDQLLVAFQLLVNLTVLGSIILFFAAVSYIVSWCVTQAYKMLYLTHASWKQEATKRKIYRVAIWSGSITMLACGSFFLLAEELRQEEKIVLGVFWLIACAVVGFSSPLLWRWTFDKVLPRFNRFVAGKNDEGENEAMDRPSEKPE